MTWATRRRLVIGLIVGAVLLAILAAILAYVFYEAPSCSDNKQNQDEVGIDCGGSCKYLCTAREIPPTILFTGIIQNASGRTDLISSVVNKNADSAAKDVPYKISLYDARGSLIKVENGSLDLPPRTTVPIFIPGITLGGQSVVRAFLEIASSSPRWVPMATDPRIVPVVLRTTIGGTTSVPRVEATLENPSIIPISNAHVVVFVHAANGNIIASSETVISSIASQGQATATFIWNEPFASTPAQIEVVPVIPLP